MEIRRDYNETVTLFTDKDLLHTGENERGNVERRIEKDAMNIRKVCAKYIGSISPWLPTKPVINIDNFYLNTDRKLGWCVNPKVSKKNN